ncbi:amidohydrolase family protein [Saccharopolyspora sp. ASAGF58]|uniref:metal-dependent hydrolase family protein n=1 Tax=Saccharopolyspora sp. ASAGF58 TaxID=2719023 RepID=UPI00143FFC9D|nr:amidohydrolase family protein [Saccharopolyspora sp. ASAGF58]QIZ37789.1 amidohydrolase family protein [Saccharopolyspora sp. ASAGF58]
MNKTTSRTRSFVVRRFVDGLGSPVRSNIRVSLHDGRIVDVRSARSGTASSKDDIDLGDCTMLPGLVDAHVHLVWNAGRVPHEEVVLDSSQARTALRMAGRARTMLRSGVTTARDLGATDSLSIPVAEAIESGEIEGPTLVACGRAIAMTGGHAWQITAAADGADDIRRAVREEIKRGATAIKVMASGGVYDRNARLDQAQLTLAELSAAAEEAHKAGLRVAAHAYTPGPINLALDAGADTIEHGSFLDEATARRMRKSGSYFVPTMMASHLIAQQAELLGTPSHMRCKAAEVRDAVRDAVTTALRVGTPIAGGSDSGGAGIDHGRLSYEAQLLVECGATPLEAMRICTSGSATAIGLGDTHGSLEEGKAADLLVVRGDPSTDIRALNEVRLVVKAGREVPSA